MKTTGPTKHARLSPSGASRWMYCPYSAQSDLPRFENPQAAAGDEAHHACASVLLDKMDMSDVHPDYREGVEMYVETVLAVPGGQPLIVEQYWGSLEIDDHGGTMDCLIVEPQQRKAYITDYKNGKHAVKAARNTQLLCYAGIVVEHFNVDSVVGTIVQPNTTGKQQVTTAEYSAEEIANHRNIVRWAATSTEKRTGRCCLFCPLRLNRECREGMAYAAERGWKYGREYGPGVDTFPVNR